MAILPTLPSGDHGDDDRRIPLRPGLPSPGSSAPSASAPAASAAAVDLADLVIDLSDALAEGPAPRPVRRCRPASPDELPWTAAIHARELPGGFFVRFGPRFLARYHDSFRCGPFSVALVNGPAGDPGGFVVGTWDNARHYRWLVRHVGPLARSGLVAMVLRPRLAYEVVTTRGRRYARTAVRLLRRGAGSGATPSAGAGPGPERADVPATEEPAPVVAVLSHVAVAEHARGTGLGRELVDAFVDHARDRGADEVRLIAHVSTTAPGFYHRLGWCSLGERTASDGTIVEEFQLVL